MPFENPVIHPHTYQTNDTPGAHETKFLGFSHFPGCVLTLVSMDILDEMVHNRNS